MSVSLMSLSSKTVWTISEFVLDLGYPVELSKFGKVTSFELRRQEASSRLGRIGEDAGRQLIVAGLLYG